jgi:hypothetical protein
MGWLSNLIVKITGDNKGLKTSLNDSEKSVGVFGNAIKKLGGMIAAAFAVGKLLSFGKEIIGLAAKAEGVRQGFSKLNDPELLMQLRTATRGTVSDLELMQRAVQASNFQIPLKDLAALLKFASQRALQTGQSVDYLVDSIVLGIGRKSPLILDNLGISAVRLRQELKGAGVEMTTVGDVAAAVGKIASEEMAKMGEVADTTATKLGNISSAWTNIKTSMGTLVTESELLRKSLEGVANALQNISERGLLSTLFEKRSTWEKRQTEKANWDIPSEYVPYWDKGNMLPEVNVSGKKTEPKIQIKREKPISKMSSPAMPDYFLTQMVQGTNKGEGPNLEGLRESNIELEREMTKMEEILTEGRDMAFDLGTQVIEGLAEAMSGGDIKDIGKGLLLSLANFLSQFGKLLITMGLGLEAFAKSLATMNPVVAIVAGTAMLVAAGAIRGLVSRGSSTVSGGGGSSYGSGNFNAQNVRVEVIGKISGKDIVIASKRYINDNG